MKPWTEEDEAEWQRCRGWLKASYDYWPQVGSFEEIEAAVRSREFMLWPHEDSAAVTMTRETTKGREAYVVLAGGRMDTLAMLLDVVGPWYKALGCERIVFFGRKGWTRSVMAEKGFRQTAVILTKEL